MDFSPEIGCFSLVWKIGNSPRSCKESQNVEVWKIWSELQAKIYSCRQCRAEYSKGVKKWSELGQDEESDILIFHCYCWSFVLKRESEPKAHVSKKMGILLMYLLSPHHRVLWQSLYKVLPEQPALTKFDSFLMAVSI